MHDNLDNSTEFDKHSKNEKYDVIVVGAGLAGLSCAYRLCEKNKKVLLLEAHSYPGGRTSSFTDCGMKVESGLHRYIGYYSALPKLLKKCDVRIKDIVTWEENADILIKNDGKDGKDEDGGKESASTLTAGKRKVVLGVAPMFGFKKTMRGVFGNRDFLSARDKLSLVPFFICGFGNYVFSQNLDRYSVAEYANRHHVSEKAKRLILEPLSSGIFFLPPENYSAYAFFGLFAPAIPKFYKMRIGAFLGGMTEVMAAPIAKKIEESGGEILYNMPVKRVIVRESSAVGREKGSDRTDDRAGDRTDDREYDSGENPKRIGGVETEAGDKYFAPAVVIATTLPEAKKILADFRDDARFKNFFRLPCMSSCTLQLELDSPALKKDVTTFGPGTDIVSFAEQSRSTFRESRGRLSVILGNPAEYAKMSAEKILPVVLRQMAELGVHLKGKVVEVRKVAEENEFYSLDKGSQRFRPKQRTGVEGLFLAGDYTLTSSFATMEGAVKSGRKAAKECIRAAKKCIKAAAR